MMTICPSVLQIARWEAGAAVTEQKREWLIEHSRGCSRCSALIAEIVAARRELFPRESAVDIAAAAQTVIAAAAQQRAQRSGRWRRFRLLAGIQVLVVLTAAALLSRKMNAPTRAGLSAEAVAAQAGARNKGQLVLKAFCKRGDTVLPVGDGAALVSGDRLRFGYSAPAAGHLMIFGVDDRGQIFPYYGEGSLSSVPVGAGSMALLPGSIELGDHHGHGRERIFALWAAQPIDAKRVQVAVTQAMVVGADVARVVALDIDVDQTSLLLRRP
ncbi:MAG TPA: hypothetical protein VH374_01610 [Polyangia bacterium]|jgi:hypothetical protein|nr:hypothetical protein [Polyangia bacterium]